jgi:hypothetical protein
MKNPGSGTAPAVMETHVKYIQIFSKQGLNLFFCRETMRVQIDHLKGIPYDLYDVI